MASSSHHKIKKHMALVATTQRTVEVWERPYDAEKLKNNNWNFQIAKSVNNGDGQNNFNVVWQSKNLAPDALIVWKDAYALNWTSVVPAPGLSVTISGLWQLCALGESYDLNDNGFWAKSPSTTQADPKFMNVGNISYKYPSVDGIHIVIGVLNDGGDFDIIYVDPVALPPTSSAKYQPQEYVKWWYQTDMRTATMISSASTSAGTVDFSAPAPATNKFYYSTTYAYDSGTWATSTDTPPQRLYAPPTEPVVWSYSQLGLTTIWPAILNVLFKVALGPAQKLAVSAKVGAILRVRYKDVNVDFLTDLKAQVSIGGITRARPNTIDSIAIETDTIVAEVNDAVQFEADAGDLPSNESWDINVTGGGVSA